MSEKSKSKAEIDTTPTEMQRGTLQELGYSPIEGLKSGSNIRSGALPNIPELMSSIEATGLGQALTVREGKNPGEFEIVDGYRRFQALSKLHEKYGDDWDVVDFANIPIAIQTGGDESFTLIQQATANLQRVDTAPEDLASAVERLLGPEFNMEVPQVASYLGKKSQFILDLIKFSQAAGDDLKKLVREGKYTFSQAVDSLDLSEEQQADIKKLAKATKNKTESKKKVKKAIDAAGGKAEGLKSSKKGAKEQSDKLMVCRGILGDKEIFSTLDPKEVDLIKGTIATLEWALGQRNTLNLPVKAEKAYLSRYEELAKKEAAAQEAEKLKAKAAKAKEKAEETSRKAAEAAAAAEAAISAAA